MVQKNEIKRIAVRGPNWVGDTVMSVPALKLLSALFPAAEIDLLLRGSVADLFEDADFVNSVVAIDDPGSKIRSVRENTAFLASRRYDLAVILTNSFEPALSTLFAGIPRRIGYNKDLRGLLLTDPVPVPDWKTRRHEVFFYLHLIAEVGNRILGRPVFLEAEPDASFTLSQSRIDSALSLIKEAGVGPQKNLVAVGAGSTNSRAKRWGLDRFAELCERLVDELDVSVVLLGGPNEVEIAENLVGERPNKIIDLIGKTSVADAAALLKQCRLLVANDMGLAHLAPAVGTKTAVIFGPTDPVTTRPFSDDAFVIREAVDCSPCMLRDCPIDHRCMTRITVDRVFAACKDLLFFRNGRL